MSLQVEKLEKNMAKLTIEALPEELEKAIQKVYLRARGQIQVPGFRKGKAPRNIIEKVYGRGVFLEDAANELIPDAYSKAVEESGLNIVSRPELEVTQMEQGKPFIFTAAVALKPEVTLGEYKGLEVPAVDRTVTDEDVDKEIKREQEKNARTVTVEDRGAEKDDTVTIDFEGFVDGEAFEGGKGSDYPLVIGSNTFIPGFEEQLIGAKTGEHVEVNVTFPEDYQAENLAGKAAVFQCDIKKIETKEYPELDDEFAQDVSEKDTFEEYREEVRENLQKKKDEQARTELENAAVDKVIENAEMEIPDAMVDTQVEQMYEDFAGRLQAQGLSVDQYFTYTGMTAASFREDAKPQALKRIKTRLVLEKVVEAENIQPTDEEFAEELEKLAKTYNMEVDKVKELFGEKEIEQMKEDISVQKAVTLIADAVKEI